ncbi:MAG: DUF1697 domain-containing protein [Acidobacteriota bacterium]
MPKYVAFLRAINVGGHTVKMDYLRQLCAGLGLANVETFIASGNVIFDSKSGNARALEQKIEKHLRENLGYEVRTFVRAAKELAAVSNFKSFSAGELKAPGHRLYVGFLSEKPGKEAKKKLSALSCPTDDFAIHEREVYWLCRTSFSESAVSGALLEKTLGLSATFRNVNTVRRLAEKYS